MYRLLELEEVHQLGDTNAEGIRVITAALLHSCQGAPLPSGQGSLWGSDMLSALQACSGGLPFNNCPGAGTKPLTLFVVCEVHPQLKPFDCHSIEQHAASRRCQSHPSFAFPLSHSPTVPLPISAIQCHPRPPLAPLRSLPWSSRSSSLSVTPPVTSRSSRRRTHTTTRVRPTCLACILPGPSEPAPPYDVPRRLSRSVGPLGSTGRAAAPSWLAWPGNPAAIPERGTRQCIH